MANIAVITYLLSAIILLFIVLVPLLKQQGVRKWAWKSRDDLVLCIIPGVNTICAIVVPYLLISTWFKVGHHKSFLQRRGHAHAHSTRAAGAAKAL
jgi:hypothetical protein